MYMLYDNKGKIRLPNPNLGFYVVQNFLIEIAATPVNQRAPQRVASERMTTHQERTWYVLGILNANRKIRKRTDTDVAFTREYSRVSIFHRERECTN